MITFLLYSEKSKNTTPITKIYGFQYRIITLLLKTMSEQVCSTNRRPGFHIKNGIQVFCYIGYLGLSRECADHQSYNSNLRYTKISRSALQGNNGQLLSGCFNILIRTICYQFDFHRLFPKSVTCTKIGSGYHLANRRPRKCCRDKCVHFTIGI